MNEVIVIGAGKTGSLSRAWLGKPSLVVVMNKKMFFLGCLVFLSACGHAPDYSAGYLAGLSAKRAGVKHSVEVSVRPEQKTDYAKGWRAAYEEYCYPYYAQAEGSLGSSYTAWLCESKKQADLRVAWLSGLRNFCSEKKAYQAGLRGEPLPALCALHFNPENLPAYQQGEEKKAELLQLTAVIERLQASLRENASDISATQQALQVAQADYYQQAFIPEKEVSLNKLRLKEALLEKERQQLQEEQAEYQKKESLLYTYPPVKSAQHEKPTR
eukprot:TRINITY_DN245_c2_g4_i1.p2 TRINITY_DN245_c2_g4~~TRINITY_DN245_c2_g4_i1.p2  ORF type:complete len:271 (+),score=-46.18 TRINITY_DN245_c2_g4_i1:84-896(+)